jgi:thioredoxin-like negative regulator of GroEL
VAVFTSQTCASCEAALAKAAVLASREVAFQDVSYQVRKDLHQRYGIETVPMILVADLAGVVKASFIGAPPAADLWASLAEVRQA